MRSTSWRTAAFWCQPGTCSREACNTRCQGSCVCVLGGVQRLVRPRVGAGVGLLRAGRSGQRRLWTHLGRAWGWDRVGWDPSIHQAVIITLQLRTLNNASRQIKEHHSCKSFSINNEGTPPTQNTLDAFDQTYVRSKATLITTINLKYLVQVTIKIHLQNCPCMVV